MGLGMGRALGIGMTARITHLITESLADAPSDADLAFERKIGYLCVLAKLEIESAAVRSPEARTAYANTMGPAALRQADRTVGIDLAPAGRATVRPSAA